MAKTEKRDFTNVALIFAVILYLMGGIFAWHVLAVSASEGYSGMNESFSPMGMWYIQNSNSTNYSIFIPLPSELITGNSSYAIRTPAYTQARGDFFSGLEILYLLTLSLIAVMGIFVTWGVKNARFIFIIIITALILISIIYFTIAYQNALNTDLENSNISEMSMFGDEIVTTEYRIDSHLGVGFLLTILSMVAFGTAAMLDRAYVAHERALKNKEKRKYVEGELPIMTAGNSSTTRKEEEKFEDVVIECPTCGREFEVRVNMDKLPVKVQCPYCGTEGEIG